MATLTSHRNTNSRFGNLPTIKHPSLRLPKGDPIEIHGSASRDGSIKGSLPPLRTENNPLIHIKTRRHSRGSTWPIDQEKDSKDGQHLLTLTQKKSVEELVDLINEKLSGSFYGIRQAFKAKDPQGKGVISREAFKNILYHLCGYVSAAQFSGLLQRFGLESRTTVAFDDFIRHFKDNEVVDKVWIDPVVRPTNTSAHLPANRLKNLQRQQAAMRESSTKYTIKMFTALQVFPMLKRKVRDNFLEFAKLLPTSCFDLDGTVLKPQLKYALYNMNVHMYDEEFDKVWDRFDRSGLGTVDSQTFFKILGLRRIEMEPSDIINDVIEDNHVTPEIPSPEQDEVIPTDESKLDKTTPSPIKDIEPEATPETIQGDVLKLLLGKFRSGYNSILQLCAAFDTENTGTISRAEFRHVLSKCRLNLGPIEVEHLLSRFGVRDQERVNYHEILDSLEDRTERGLLQKILEDKKHRFNRSRESDVGNTSAIDAEAKLLDIIHSDFLALLAAFKQLDQENVGVVKKYQFQEMLAARFGIQLTRKQTVDLLKKTGAEASDGLVSYGKFLEMFSSRSVKIDKHREKSPVVVIQDRPSTTPARSPRPPSTRPATVQSVRPPTEIEPRDADQLLVEIGNLVTEKYDVIKKTFIGIDKISRNCGHLTRETFRKLFDRHNLKMTSSEVGNIWKKLPVERDGTLNFIELVKTCFNEAGKSPPASDSDKPGQVGSLSRVLQNYARTHVKETLERFPEEDEDQQLDDIPMEITEDDNITEHVDVNFNIEQETSAKVGDIIFKIKNEVRNHFTQIQDEFRDVCHESRSTIDVGSYMDILLKYCKSLNSAECSKLCQRFDKENTGRVKYKEFLKVFVPTMPEGSDPIASRCHSRHSRSRTYPSSDRPVISDALNTVMYKLRNKMIHDWKALRRAMKKYDHKDDGMISIADFKSNLKEFGFYLTDEDFFHILSQFDVKMDGQISYVAFMKLAVL